MSVDRRVVRGRVVSDGGDSVSLEGFFRLRKDVVRAAIVWLCENNIVYLAAGVELDLDALDMLPPDGTFLDAQALERAQEEDLTQLLASEHALASNFLPVMVLPRSPALCVSPRLFVLPRSLAPCVSLRLCPPPDRCSCAGAPPQPGARPLCCSARKGSVPLPCSPVAVG
jgi:hypothetical protein